MNRGTRLRAVGLTVGILIVVGGCTTSTADGPSSTAIATVTVSPSVIDPSSLHPGTSASPPSPSPSAVEPSTSTAASSDISPQEAADRAAIEAQWSKFWDVYVGIVRTPADQRSAVLDPVSVDPIKYRILQEAADFESQGLDNYGSVVPKVYQIDFVGSNNQAVIQDCQDQSAYGSLFVGSGKKRTVGVSDNHLQAGLVRSEDGVWKVQTIQAVENIPC